ncbi:glycosyltransferase family 2 protein [Cupriavidus basilensis]
MSYSQNKVTVVVPTYKRAHLLHTTIPSYLQPEVEQLILVDDCSPDDTGVVAQQLIQKYPQITYIRNAVNSKQTASKNRGKALAHTEYLYFGDDDSILSEGAIGLLLQTAKENAADIVGASALYLRDGEDDFSGVMGRRKLIKNANEIADLSRLQFDFSAVTDQPMELPVCHASFLIRADAARSVDFDIGYIGNCYREETDYLVRCRAAGMKVLYDSRAVQINLPPAKATGGARGRGRLSYEGYALYNTMRFAVKNRKALRRVDPRCHPAKMVVCYLEGRVRAAMLRMKVT